MAEDTIGTARMEIAVDLSQYEAAIKAGETRLTGMSSSFQTEFAKMDAASKRATLRILDQANTLNMTKEQVLAYGAALKTNGVILDELTKKIATNAAAQSASAETYVMSAKAQAAAMRGVPAQITDIVTSLQGGQKPITVLLQQGGQLKDMFGGIVPAASALGSALVSMVNPFTLAAAGVAALAYAFYEGSSEQSKFADALIITGNAAGETADGLHTLALSAAASGGSLSVAKDAVLQLAASGKYTSEQIGLIARTATEMESATGQAVGETIKQFEELRKSPVEASAKLNEQYHYLTLSVYEQIQALIKQGQVQEAVNLAERTYADAMDGRTASIKDNIGVVEKAWRAAKEEAAAYWDTVLGIGRTKSNGDRLAVAQNQLNSMVQTAGNVTPDSRAAKDIAEKRAEIAKLQSEMEADQKDAAEKNKVQQEKDGKIAASAWINSFRKEFATQAEKRDQEIADYTVRATKLGLSPEVQTADVAKIKDKYKDKSQPEDKAALTRDIDAIKAVYSGLADIYTNSEKVLENSHKDGLISDAEYYEAKREFIRLNADSQQKELELEIARYQKQKATGADAIANQSKIQQAQAQIEKLRVDAATKGQLTIAQEIANQNKLASSYLSAQQAAQSYFDTQERQQQRSLDSIGRGQIQRNFDSGINQIDDKYAQQILTLENQRALLEAQKDDSGSSLFSADEQKKYDERLALIKMFQQKSIESYRDYYSELMEKQGDWQLGLKEGLQDYADATKNVFEQMKSAVSDSFKGAEDSLVKFVTTGKLSFADMVTSIENDLARMVVRQNITGPLANLLNSAFGNGLGNSTSMLGSAGFGATPFGANPGNTFGSLGSGFFGLGAPHADGGPTAANGLYPVNERGPELLTISGKDYLMMGSKGGMVTSHERSMSPINAGLAPRSSMPVTVNLTNAPAGTTATATSKQDSGGGLSIDILFSQIQSRIATDVNNGEGPLHKSISGRFGLKPVLRR